MKYKQSFTQNATRRHRQDGHEVLEEKEIRLVGWLA